MSTSLTNYHVRMSSSIQVADALRHVALGRAFVSKPTNGWVSVVDETSEMQGDAQVRRLAKDLSRRVDAPVISFRLEDGSVLEYRLFRRGKLADEYSSNPEYGGPVSLQIIERSRGRPAALVSGLGAKADLQAVCRVLDRGAKHTFQDERLAQLARALGLLPSRALQGFRAQMPRGWTPIKGKRLIPANDELLRAVEAEDAGAVQRLLEAGASADARNSYGTSALVLAASVGSTKIVDSLLRAGARDDATLLAPASATIVRRLLRSGADPNFKASDGRTPLWSVVRGGDRDVLEILLAAGGRAKDSVDIAYHTPRRKERGMTLLMYAPTAEVAGRLVKAGVDVNARDARGMTALMWAARWGRADVAGLLLKAGADHSVRNRDGESAEDIATTQGRRELVRLLQKHAGRH